MYKRKIKHDFLCVGFPKCGTTTLHEILVQHKDIYLPLIKEPIYYWNPEFLNKGFQWYLKRYYPKYCTKKCIGEINPTMIARNNAARIRKDFGKNIKLIFIMRNPVDRLYSHFKHLSREEGILVKERKNMSNSEQFDLIIHNSFITDNTGTHLSSTLYKNIIEDGNYYKIISNFIKYFPIENMKFIYFEDLIVNPHKVCNSLYNFLNIKDDKKINYNIHANDGKRIAKNLKALQIHHIFYETVWLNYLLHFPLNINLLTKFLLYLDGLILKLTTKNIKDDSKISESTRKTLEQYYRPDKEKLEQLLKLKKGSLWFN